MIENGSPRYDVVDVASESNLACLRAIVALIGDWRRSERRAAATLALGITTTPFDQRELVLAALLGLAGLPPPTWSSRVAMSGDQTGNAIPREAFMQLIDRERTYLSQVPVESPLARLCRALVRSGVLESIDANITTDLIRAGYEGTSPRARAAAS